MQICICSKLFQGSGTSGTTLLLFIHISYAASTYQPASIPTFTLIYRHTHSRFKVHVAKQVCVGWGVLITTSRTWPHHHTYRDSLLLRSHNGLIALSPGTCQQSPLPPQVFERLHPRSRNTGSARRPPCHAVRSPWWPWLYHKGAQIPSPCEPVVDSVVIWSTLEWSANHAAIRTLRRVHGRFLVVDRTDTMSWAPWSPCAKLGQAAAVVSPVSDIVRRGMPESKNML